MVILLATGEAVLFLSLADGKISSSLSVTFSDARGVAYDVDGKFIVSDRGEHRVVQFSCDNIFMASWGDSCGNNEGPLQNSEFDGPYSLCCEGKTVYVVCEGSRFGSRICRISSFDLLKEFLFHANLVYKCIGYVDRRCRKDTEQMELDSSINIVTALAMYGRPSVTYFEELVNTRRHFLGKYIMYVCF